MVTTTFIFLSYLAIAEKPNEKDAHSFMCRMAEQLDKKSIKLNTSFHGCMDTYDVKCIEPTSMLNYWESNHFIDILNDEKHSIKIKAIFQPTLREYTRSALQR